MRNPLIDTPADGLPAFAAIRPEHVEVALQATLAANRAELERHLERSRSGSPTFERDVLPLEELGDRLHRVWSPVSHLHAVANTPDLREAYNHCLPHLSRYNTEIGQNAELYHLFEKVSATIPRDRADGARALVDQALRDFRLAGVRLPEDKKHRFMDVMEELDGTAGEVRAEPARLNGRMVPPGDRPARVDGIPQSVLERAAEAAAAAGKPAGTSASISPPTSRC